MATYHKNAATFAFLDGHAERHSWKHKETWVLFDERKGQKAPSIPPVNSNLDIQWCWEHYPYLSENEKPKGFQQSKDSAVLIPTESLFFNREGCLWGRCLDECHRFLGRFTGC